MVLMEQGHEAKPELRQTLIYNTSFLGFMMSFTVAKNRGIVQTLGYQATVLPYMLKALPKMKTE